MRYALFPYICCSVYSWGCRDCMAYLTERRLVFQKAEIVIKLWYIKHKKPTVSYVEKCESQICVPDNIVWVASMNAPEKKYFHLFYKFIISISKFYHNFFFDWTVTIMLFIYFAFLLFCVFLFFCFVFILFYFHFPYLRQNFLCIAWVFFLY